MNGRKEGRKVRRSCETRAQCRHLARSAHPVCLFEPRFCRWLSKESVSFFHPEQTTESHAVPILAVLINIGPARVRGPTCTWSSKVLERQTERHRVPPPFWVDSIHGRIDYNHRPRQYRGRCAMTQELRGSSAMHPGSGVDSQAHIRLVGFELGYGHSVKPQRPAGHSAVLIDPLHLPRSANATSPRRSCTSGSLWTNATTLRPLFLSFRVSKAPCPNPGDGAWS
jgi:hypothetical protein